MSLTSPLEQVPAGALPRHRHAYGYAAVVLSGAYEEAGDNGRRWVGPGQVIAHGPFSAHLNRIPAAGARVLNLPFSHGAIPAFAAIPDPDAVARAAERDPHEAAALVVAQHTVSAVSAHDWPDLLAEALADAPVPIGDWARAHGLTPAYVARAFRSVFGVTPQVYGREARARTALDASLFGSESLADIAQATGFADQAHMTRAVVALSGRAPGAWRRSNPFKTGGADPAI